MPPIPTPPFAGATPSWQAPPPPRRPWPGWWDAPLTELPGVGPAAARAAASLGIASVGQLLTHLPARYETFEEGARPVADLVAGEEATVRVRLESIAVRPTRRRRLRMVRARVRDDTGRLVAIWFNQEHLARLLSPGDTLLLRGQVRPGAPPELTVKSHEVLGAGGSEGLHTQGLVPVYPATEAITPRRLRELVDRARPLAAAVPERLTAAMRVGRGLPTAADALLALHFPRDRGESTLGRRRLALEELLVLQLGLLALRRNDAARFRAPALAATNEHTRPLLAALPFTLTAEQRRAARRIARDLAGERPMRRLLQGEVGSGKTLVAALGLAQAVEAGAQAALLVPTETLAEQHLRTLDGLLAPAGIAPVLITGRVPRAERERRLLALRTGTAPIAVGTQALLSEGVAFAKLGLVVVDEQHRFGVTQRQALAERVGGGVHLLYMTATPIPRTLALTAFGELETSVIRRRPPGRAPVATRWVREAERESAYAQARGELRAGRQAYVICPMVGAGEGEAEMGGEAEARSAIAEAERLRAGPFAGFRVGLAHGAQRTDDKRAAMSAFAAGELDLLVATTVVEVGIDVPNATVMLIEDAARFGLAQLHQLRGRVGRGSAPGVCLLLGDAVGEEGARRLEALTQTSDGFRLAALDLEIRGAGAVLGVRQAGASDLRFARLAYHRKELAEARRLARWTLRDDPRLEAPEHALLRAAVRARFAEVPRLLEA